MKNKQDIQLIITNGKGTLFVDGKMYGTTTEVTISPSKTQIAEPEAPLDTKNVITVRFGY